MSDDHRQHLIVSILEGNSPNYLFFWEGQQPVSPVNHTCLSQWYHAPFVIGDVIFKTAEHYMMASKANLFKDYEMETKILNSNTPYEAKKLGRKVKNFNQNEWSEKCFSIVVGGNLAKFSQHDELRSFLINTGDDVLVESSPVDKIWGIGLHRDDSDSLDPRKWKGYNLLGFALMEVRQTIIDSGATGVKIKWV